jgi:hypothetical protein
MEEARIPADLSGFVVVIPLQLNLEVDGVLLTCAELFRSYFLLFLSYGVQAVFLYQIALIDEDKAGNCDDGRLYFLSLICVFTFTVSIFEEANEIKNLAVTLYKCPSRQEFYTRLTEVCGVADQATIPTALRNEDGARSPRRCAEGPPGMDTKHGAILEAEREAAKSAKSLMDHMSHFARMLKPGQRAHEVLDEWTLDGMTWQWKAWSFVVVVLPRILLTVALFCVGAFYIMRSGDKGQMIMNTLAVNFIVDIDDQLYKVFTSGSLKVHMENVKPIPLHPTNMDRLVSFLFASIVSPALAVGISVGFVSIELERCKSKGSFF